MRDVPASMEAVWRSGQYLGDQRPFARVTVQRPHMRLHNVSFPAKATPPTSGPSAPSGTASTTTGTPARTIAETYANFLFGPDSTTPKELPNVKEVQWQRNIDSDVAECTITFFNTAPLGLGELPTRDLDAPGFYTYSRGDTSFASRWGQKKNEWSKMLMPDNLLRTYEGYGYTDGVPPERDLRLVLTGVWMIDTVTHQHDGTLSVTCRDLGRLLLDQIVFPPVIPSDFYPLSFHKVDKVSGFIEGKTYVTRLEVSNGVVTPMDPTTPLAGVNQPTVNGKPRSPVTLSLQYDTSSNYVFERTASFDYIVRKDDWLIKLAARFNVSGGWRAIYNLNKARIDSVAEDHNKPGGGHWIFPGEVLKIPGSSRHGTDVDTNGHLAKHAFDSDWASYWLSVGHDRGNRAQDYEWIQGKLNGATLTQVSVTVAKAGYTMYLSVHDGKRWVRHRAGDVIGYRPPTKDLDNGADIAYCEKIVCNKGPKTYTFTLRNPVPNAVKVRVTFHNLQKFNADTTGGDYHSAVRTITAHGYARGSTPKPPKPTKPIQLSPFIRGVGDNFAKGVNTKSLGRASVTGDLWQYKDGGAGRSAHWLRSGGIAKRTGGLEGSSARLVWAMNNLQYRHQRADATIRGIGLSAPDNPTWYLALRFRERGTQIYHVEASCTRRGLATIAVVRNNVRTVLGTAQLPGGSFNLADGTWRLAASVTRNVAKLWVVKSNASTTYGGTPLIVVTDDLLNNSEMGYHLAFSTSDHKAGFASFNAYGNYIGGIFDSFARPNSTKLDRAESGHIYRFAGPAASPWGTKTIDTWGVTTQQAKRRNTQRQGERLWALANLGSITQDVRIRAYPNSTSGDLWMMAVRVRDTANMIYYTVDQAGWLTLYTVKAGVSVQVFRNRISPSGFTARTDLRATIIDTELSIYVNGNMVYRLDDPNQFGNPGFGSMCGFGSEKLDIVYDVFDASVPGTSGGGPGTDADPTTTIIEYETYVPPHIEAGAGAKPGTYEDYCADEDTEIFTRRGWLTWEQVQAGDETLTIDPRTGLSEWGIIQDVYRKHRTSRDMIRLDSTVHSSVTTPNHRWLVQDQAGDWLWRTSETLRTGHRIPLAVPRSDLPTDPKFSDALVELVAWTYTEGWLQEANQGLSLAQSSRVNPVHVDRIRTALTVLWGKASSRRSRVPSPTWVERTRGDGVVIFSISAAAAREVLALAPAKVPSMDFLTNLTAGQLALFIDVSVWADGWQRGRQRFFGQNRGPRLDAFLAACALAGQGTSVTGGGDYATVTLLRSNGHLPINAAQSGHRAVVEHQNYTGVVWCPTLPRNHNWLARRRGTTYFTGNTDIIKLMCAWGGFYWPMDGKQRISDGTIIAASPGKEDPTLGREGVGRVWGDFEQTGTAGITDLTMDLFDKHSLMDAISYVRDIIGFIFMIDETGAAVWRAPNIYGVGNNVAAFSTNPRRTTEMIEIDEKQTLMSLQADLNSRNIREHVFIATADGAKGATAAGWNPNPVGLRRVGGWTDQNFASTAECQVMADLITVRQLFSYRNDSVTVPGFPKLQVDDQVRIFEQTTSEGYIHYIKGISSSLSMETGSYTYNLDTHWLGEAPFTKWVFDPAQLSQATQEYLKAVRLERDGDTWYELPRGTTIPDKLAVNLVFDGNALTRGTGAGEGNDYPTQAGIALTAKTTANLRRSNSAGTAITTPQLSVRAPATIDTQRNAVAFNANILTIWEGSYHLAAATTATGDKPAVLTARQALRTATATRIAKAKLLSDATTGLAAAQKSKTDSLAAKAKAQVDIATYTAALVPPGDEQYTSAYQVQLRANIATLNQSVTRLDQLVAAANTAISTGTTAVATATTALNAAKNAEGTAAANLAAALAVLGAGLVSEVDVHNAIKAYCLARKAAGWKVIVLTILPRRDAAWTNGQAADFEATRFLANALIRTHWAEYADALVDVAADPNFTKENAYNNATYYQSNKIYLTRAGYKLIANQVQTAIIFLLATVGGTP